MMSGSLAYKHASMLSGAPSQTDCSKSRYSWPRCEYHRVFLASFPVNYSCVSLYAALST